MSQSPSVLVAIGQGKSAKLPRQKYDHIFTRYNLRGLSVLKDNDFYNSVIASPSIPNKTQFDIYGFMGGNCKYVSDDSIQRLVDFFQKHEYIKVVVCDLLEGESFFQRYLYIQPQSTNNIPFFVRESVLPDINFTDVKTPLQNQLEILKQKYAIFHIAAPLISIWEEGSE